MAYPQAPWKLQGYTLQTLQLVDIARVRPLIPPELEIISIWPGKTIGGVYLASYGSDSVLEYNELIIVAALTRYVGKLGAWVSHIYVDNPDSVAGGREIWGLPKELAQFTWEQREQPCVRVHQGDQLLCSLNYEWRLPGWQQQLAGNAFSTFNRDLLYFKAKSELRLCLGGAKLQIPAESPFSRVGLNQPWLSFYCDRLRLVVSAPKVVGETASPFGHSSESLQDHQ
jgi:hypothetical protein